MATFLGSASRDGLASAARQFLGLTQLIGRDVHGVLADLASRIAPAGATTEDAAARAALLETFSAFAEELAREGRDLADLDHLDSAAIGSVLREFVTNYVSERFLQELGVQIDRDQISVEDARDLFRDVTDTVRATVAVDFAEVDVATFDWAGAGGRARVERIFREAYSLLEDL